MVAWIPLDSPDEAAAQLDQWHREPVVGIGHRGHDARDPDWLLDRAVDDSLALLTERRLTLDLTAHSPRIWGTSRRSPRTTEAHGGPRPPR